MLSPQARTDFIEISDYIHLLNSRRILLLEEDPEIARTIGEILRPNSCRVTTAASGPAALSCIMKQRDFEVVLCDMATEHPPGMMFYLAVKRIRPELCPRFIFLTGRTGNAQVESFIRGVNGVILWKPFEPHILVETVNLILKKGEKHAGLLGNAVK